ncbi:hypothetical protein AB0M20_00485 [Actinoplanes sp. NPDC051633]
MPLQQVTHLRAVDAVATGERERFPNVLDLAAARLVIGEAGAA